MDVKLICQSQYKLMLENLLRNSHIAVRDDADIAVVEKGMDYNDDCRLAIIFTIDYVHTLVNVLQGSLGEDAPANMFLGRQGDDWVPVVLEDVLYINAQGNDTYINLEDGRSLKIKYKLYQLEEGLLPNSFIRINKSEIVNIRKIRSITPMFKGNLLIYMNGCKLPLDISRNFVKSFKERLCIT